MDHFDGITPEQRWKNDMLNEIRELNKKLREFNQGKAGTDDVNNQVVQGAEHDRGSVRRGKRSKSVAG